MAQAKANEKTKSATKETAKPRKQWTKPKITRHGNMRQLTQMSA